VGWRRDWSSYWSKDLKDELGVALQMCDQLTYDNVFVYYQPGNGKVKVKEPTDLAIKA
jgi:hypothetical protein